MNGIKPGGDGQAPGSGQQHSNQETGGQNPSPDARGQETTEYRNFFTIGSAVIFLAAGVSLLGLGHPALAAGVLLAGSAVVAFLVAGRFLRRKFVRAIIKKSLSGNTSSETREYYLSKVREISGVGSASEQDQLDSKLRDFVSGEIRGLEQIESAQATDRERLEKLKEILFNSALGGGDTEDLRKIFGEHAIVPARKMLSDLQLHSVTAPRVPKEDLMRAQTILGGVTLNSENARKLEDAYNWGVILRAWMKEMTLQPVLNILDLIRTKGIVIYDVTALFTGDDSQKIEKTVGAMIESVKSGKKFAVVAKGQKPEDVQSKVTEMLIERLREMDPVTVNGVTVNEMILSQMMIALKRQDSDTMSLDTVYQELLSLNLVARNEKAKLVSATFYLWDWETNSNVNIEIHDLLAATLVKPVVRLQKLINNKSSESRFLKIFA
ncbi:MAG: hypothetical protein HYY63_01795 [Elusimicrobia bacterium]|nr:hypothetical protein [Elusimicrobiota bacterium]